MDSLSSLSKDLMPYFCLSGGRKSHSTGRETCQSLRNALVLGLTSKNFYAIVNDELFLQVLISEIALNRFKLQAEASEKKSQPLKFLASQYRFLSQWLENKPSIKSEIFEQQGCVFSTKNGLEVLSFNGHDFFCSSLGDSSSKALKISKTFRPKEPKSYVSEDFIVIAFNHSSIFIFSSVEKKLIKEFVVAGEITELHIKGNVLFVQERVDFEKHQFSIFCIDSDDSDPKIMAIPAEIDISIFVGSFCFGETYIIGLKRSLEGRMRTQLFAAPLVNQSEKSPDFWIEGPSFIGNVQFFPDGEHFIAFTWDDKLNFSVTQICVQEGKFELKAIAENISLGIGSSNLQISRMAYQYDRLFVTYRNFDFILNFFSYDLETGAISHFPPVKCSTYGPNSVFLYGKGSMHYVYPWQSQVDRMTTKIAMTTFSYI